MPSIFLPSSHYHNFSGVLCVCVRSCCFADQLCFVFLLLLCFGFVRFGVALHFVLFSCVVFFCAFIFVVLVSVSFWH